ncbi:hypothetical protein CMV_007616 [Castanea mollissima]|uniref:Nucleobase-ascorbate transporter 11 n=1 Tax=Castanea mollissima TaxID=60419 RepID=A0A8J4RLJ4_9ROSI|nr:hypothetical protein CMV_007616 [Castanea mollissima]
MKKSAKMEAGSSSHFPDKPERVKGASISSRLGSMFPKIEPFVPRIDHNPNELRSWAKRTGFVSDYSGETRASASASDKNDSAGFDLERGFDHRNGGSSPKIEIDPVLGRTRPNQGIDIEPLVKNENQRRRKRDKPVLGDREDERKVGLNGVNGNGNGNEVPVVTPSAAEAKKEEEVAEREAKIEVYPELEEEAHGGGWRLPSEMKCGLRENPGFVPLMYYGLQHYLSLAGSLIFIPLIIVPAMGGTDKDTANVISTVLLVSGITTILHSYFGTRLPLVQGSSFVFLAPALVIINAKEYRNLTEHKFRHIMRELQGAIIVGSIFQSILGFSGLMSLFLRLINPVVVAPTVAAVGLAFFSYGFPQAGSCVEISIPHIVLLLIFALYLRGISIFGHRVFRIYAVPLSVMIIWTYAFFLTAGGAYNYKGCSPDIPSSNILIDACKKHAYTMKHCRTDVSNAWRTAEWVRVPYPLQWGIPIFHLRTSMIMIIVSLVASVDSVGTYHSTSLQINSKPPTPGIVSRGIALEGLCSILAGLWGSGTGSTTLTENVYTIDMTKVANRRAVEVGAGFLILFSFVGKVGALLASIPLAMAASILCFMWALIVALGLSTLQYGQTPSFRNIAIVAASNGPAHTGSQTLDFAINALMSLNMVVTFLVAFVLDNTVPGSRQERGVYIWSRPEEVASDPSFLSDYALPRRVAKWFRWAKCLGV